MKGRTYNSYIDTGNDLGGCLMTVIMVATLGLLLPAFFQPEPASLAKSSLDIPKVKDWPDRVPWDPIDCNDPATKEFIKELRYAGQRLRISLSDDDQKLATMIFRASNRIEDCCKKREKK